MALTVGGRTLEEVTASAVGGRATTMPPIVKRATTPAVMKPVVKRGRVVREGSIVKRGRVVQGNSKKQSEKGKRSIARDFAEAEEAYDAIRNDAVVVDLMFEVYKDDPDLSDIYARHCERKALLMKCWESFRPHALLFLNLPGVKKEKGMMSDHGKKRRSIRIAENESKKKEKGMISEHGKKRRSNRIAENESKKKKQDDLHKPGQAPRPVGASIHART